MKRTISYKIWATKEIEIADYEKREDEIEEIPKRLISDAVNLLGADLNDIDIDWDVEPLASEYCPTPKDEGWVVVNGDRWAAKSAYMIREGFPVKIHSYDGWVGKDCEPDRQRLAVAIKKILLGCTSSQPHPGNFDKCFEVIKNIKGASVCGVSERSEGYVIINGALMAVIMPLKDKTENSIQFKFNE